MMKSKEHSEQLKKMFEAYQSGEGYETIFKRFDKPRSIAYSSFMNNKKLVPYQRLEYRVVQEWSPHERGLKSYAKFQWTLNRV